MSDDRKARLAALAARAGRNQSNNDDDVINNSDNNNNNNIHENNHHDQTDQKIINFRNYTPKDATLNSDESQPLKKRSKTTNDNEVNDQKLIQPPKSELEIELKQAKADAEILLRQDRSTTETNLSADGSEMPSITSIAPKKVNWDLKRDIAKKLNKLERRTQKAIVELLRERLEAEAAEEDEEGNGNDDDLD